MSVIDEREEALGRLGEEWSGEFHVGHGMDITLLRRAGIESAEAVVVTTDGDNSNIVIGQIAQKQFDVPLGRRAHPRSRSRRVLLARGLNVVCPTKNAIETLTERWRRKRWR